MKFAVLIYSFCFLFNLQAYGQELSLPLTQSKANNTTYVIDGVIVYNLGQGAKSNIQMGTYSCPFPLIPLPQSKNLERDDIEKLPCNSLDELAATQPNIHQQRRGDPINIKNGGTYGTLYILDGVQLMR